MICNSCSQIYGKDIALCPYCDKENPTKYYIVCNRYTDGWVKMFWRHPFNGYTRDLNIAAKHTLKEVEDRNYRFPIITEETISENGKYDDFLIAENDVELLGKKMICILN